MRLFHVTVRQLEIFLAIVHTGSFTAAASRLAVSQAGISRQVHALESRLGRALFVRDTGKLAKLTDHGQQLLLEAPELIKKMRSVLQQREHIDAIVNNVRVVSGDVIQNAYFFPHIIEFHRQHPEIQIEFIEMPPSLDSVERMDTEQIDLAYFTFGNQVKQLPGELIAHLPHGLFISDKHSLAHRWHPDSEESLPLILYLTGSPMERDIIDDLRAAGLKHYHISGRAQRTGTIIEMALAGMGACATLEHLVSQHVATGQLINLGLQIPPLRRQLIRNPRTQDTPHVMLVEQFLTSLITADRPHVSLQLQPLS